MVATPIGNLSDISRRGLEILGRVDLIAAEDTRHTGRLLVHFGLATSRVSLHEHNEEQQVPALVARLAQGDSIALVSDAGTPLISDPGFRLVAAAREAGIRVSPVPGPCALIAALSASGLPSDRFLFEGFLPAREQGRRRRLQTLREIPCTLIFYESSHRIGDALRDMAEVLGGERRAVVARELTKTFEQVQGDTLEGLVRWQSEDPNHGRGEFVVLVSGAPQQETGELTAEAERVLQLLLGELPLKSAARLAAEITGVSRNILYQRGLELR
ncbi:16S rRNA (cytidine(1402)-2'-O)-methyltransferase [Ectothiorhodospira lacustris]|uniref:16S rRNA (cytidine(1402)-2'-O)-methyltransferase n=1 Tax=Ectothiorhodospira lacustris TaxID=2899127 RepID=UPI001EE7FFF8|nr:16S rRNA (cytidine(1402)-2'-O)-methyltransferase [Ectothiorhodospira lacustris]MCG5510528.1 16S rRNA (cytidine(1402)-2'-O)-methyltransferase [Ectothiorhodospira lacustris]MCG5521220.1 16S rRNA (cytidine(1402)-2'-O)-methyltransferase [Ectothiorhodospira lacustris]